jgi:3-keto-5-aminohexanoate cleavage enzyme
MAMAAGGNIRVGLEDNIYYTKKNLASNEELLERLLRIASEMDISPSSIEETRGCLGLPW